MKTFETFRNISNYEIDNLTWKKPDCFNSNVTVRKYKVTIELIDEPIEVIQQRIQKLWDENQNHYNFNSLEKEAAEYDYVIKK